MLNAWFEDRRCDCACKQQPEDGCDDGKDRALAAALTPHPFGAAAALLDEKLFPIFHGPWWCDEIPMDARLGGDGALRADGSSGSGGS